MAPKIAFVIDELEVGGSQRQLYLVATGLTRRGWQVHLICLQPILAMADDFKAAGIPVHLLQKRRKLDVRLVAALSRFFVDNQINLVHLTSSTAEFFGGLATRLCRIPSVTSVRTANTALPLSHRLGKRLACRLASAVVANSRAGARIVIAAGLVAADKVCVIPNGVSLHHQSAFRDETRQRLGIPADALVVLSVGRLVWEKGYELTLALAQRASAWPRAPLFLIAGDGPLRDALTQQIRAAHLVEHVRLLGERRDVPDLLAVADVYLNTSVSEGLSNSIMEAMAAAVPVLAAAAGGTPELIVDGETGLLFPPGDLTTAALKLGRLSGDPDLRSRLGQQARRRVETVFSYDTMISQFEGLYRSVLEASARHAAFPVANGL
ncbi:MAG TPA: glycosyltransferase [Candidatus Binatia bacterium]|jgi:glycosyltransferase involved in cell wall biosynthesis|nr:glycosyltransferase [Candidatus Binatia bacterium]